MDRTQLEDRIRASLDERALDVEPTPVLWDRVADRTSRRRRAERLWWALGGTLAVAVVAFGAFTLFQPGATVSIDNDPVGTNEPGPDRDPLPAVPTPSTVVVTTDGTDVFRVDRATGAATLLERATGDEGPGLTTAVVVRPGTGGDLLTVASTVELSGMWNIRVTTWDADGALVDWQFVAPVSGSVDAVPGPRPVWSEDGTHLYWADATGEADSASTALYGLAVPDRPQGSQLGEQAFIVGRFDEPNVEPGTLALHEWRETPEGIDVVAVARGRGLRLHLTPDPACAEAGECVAPYTVGAGEMATEGGVPVALGRLANGVELTLLARTSEGGGLEDAHLAVVAEFMSDTQRNLDDLPALTPGATGSPLEGWMTVSGSQVAAGFGPTAYLATITGDLVEELEVIDVVQLPEGTVAAGIWGARDIAEPDVGPTAGDQDPREPDGPAVEEAATAPPDAMMPNGLGERVVSYFNSAREFLLQDTAAPDEPFVTWGAPGGVLPEATMADVVVAPNSTPDRLRLVTRWVVGESETLAYTEIVDGQVEVNTVFPPDRHPVNGGDLSAWPDSAPVWSPDSSAVAWVENPAAGQGPAQIRMVGITPNGPTGEVDTIPTPGDLSVHRLLDWSFDPDTRGGVTWTFAPFAADGAPSSVITYSRDERGEAWEERGLPGTLVDVGSFPFENGAQRYVVLDQGELVYGQLDAPDTAVPVGLSSREDGRLVAFGPDSLIVQGPDGQFWRVQVDDGATSAMPLPPATVALVPWNG